MAAPAARPAGSPREGIGPAVLDFCEALRREGVAIGTSEIQDAFAALRQVSWSSRSDFREALGTTIAKSQKDREIFDAMFERHFFRATEEAALERSAGGADRPPRPGEEDRGAASELSAEELSAAVRDAIAQGDEAMMGDLARLAIDAFGRDGNESGVVGVDLQRIRRGLGLSAGESDDPERPAIERDQLARFERQLRRELQRQQISRSGVLPPAHPLTDLNRALPTHGTQDLAAVHRAVSQMKRRLATLGTEHRGARRGRVVDVRRTMRASLETGGVPLRLGYRPKRPRRPEIYVLCDVSTSVTSASVFFLSVLHALHDSFRKLRSFVFIERISEVTEIFEHERDFRRVSERIAREGGVADVSGYTDYGRVWLEFLDDIVDDLGPSSTVIVLGDARTNGREAEAEVFGQIAEKAGRLYWLNPEPELYWNYGDSVMDAYAPFCDGTFECWRSEHLERFVGVIASRRPELA